ncbi:MAG: type II toxin-antitoxin system RelE/ParE family toxin [Desulfovibrionaceae bacterium]|nr:type II toxin-antitoxin system RelE/ParE family toxin [Desulfovibrionaceae bacterium]
MNSIKKASAFTQWFTALKDIKAKVRILARIDQAEHGNFGDCKPVDNGLYEMRIHYGAGYRVYYTRQGEIVYILLLGGDKSTQQKDIEKAKRLLSAILEGEKYE